MLSEHDENTLREATGRRTVADALAWIAEGRALRGGATRELLDVAGRANATKVDGGNAAYRRLVRSLLASDLDTSTQIHSGDEIVTPATCDAILHDLAAGSGGALSKVNGQTLYATLRRFPQTIDVYLQIAGLTWREARERSTAALPAGTAGPWSPGQLDAVISLVSDTLENGQRPIESLSVNPEDARAVVDSSHAGGVSYGTLLAQRIAGGSWLAHRARTTQDVRRSVASAAVEAFKARGIEHWATVGEAGETVSSNYLSTLVAKPGRKVGQVAFVTRDERNVPTAAVLLAIAHDGGTARKTGATLVFAPADLTVPAFVIVAGQGWAARSESLNLFEAFSNRVYTDNTVGELADQLAAINS